VTVKDLDEAVSREQITLSGCSTGVNVIPPGDEPIGLMRELLAAGARSLLLGLWD
jgi:CHAT domain-containing protein